MVTISSDVPSPSQLISAEPSETIMNRVVAGYSLPPSSMLPTQAPSKVFILSNDGFGAMADLCSSASSAIPRQTVKMSASRDSSFMDRIVASKSGTLIRGRRRCNPLLRLSLRSEEQDIQIADHGHDHRQRAAVTPPPGFRGADGVRMLLDSQCHAHLADLDVKKSQYGTDKPPLRVLGLYVSEGGPCSPTIFYKASAFS